MSNVLGTRSVKCAYPVKVSIHSVDGQPLGSPPPTYSLTNPGEPEEAWTTSPGVLEFVLEVQTESNPALKVARTMVIDPHYGVIAQARGNALWSITASYAGTTAFAPSHSTRAFESPNF